jgi:hypothetical protein
MSNDEQFLNEGMVPVRNDPIPAFSGSPLAGC